MNTTYGSLTNRQLDHTDFIAILHAYLLHSNNTRSCTNLPLRFPILFCVSLKYLHALFVQMDTILGSLTNRQLNHTDFMAILYAYLHKRHTLPYTHSFELFQ